MNIFNQITKQSLRQNRTRTLVTIIGVILSSALITGIAGLIASVQDYLVRSTIAETGNWHVAFWETTADAVTRIGADPEVARVFVTQELGNVQLQTVNDTAITNIVSVGDDAFEGLPVNLVSGRLPTNTDEALMPDWYQDSYQLGQQYAFPTGVLVNSSTEVMSSTDTLVFVTDGTTEFTVVGFYSDPFQGSWGRRRPLITSMATGELLGDGSYNALVQLQHPRQTPSFIVAHLDDGFFAETNEALLQFYGIFSAAGFVTAFTLLSALLVIIIMICAILLIYNAFTISVSERSKQFGILSSVGATRKQLASSVLYEGLLVAGIGIPVGILVGMGGTGIALRLVRGQIAAGASGITLESVLSFPALGIAAGLSLATILISAFIPAIRAAGQPAIDAVRQTKDVAIRPKDVRGGRFTTRFLGLEGMLARKSMKRNRKRYRSAVVSLTVSVAALISIASLMLYLDMGRAQTIADSRYNIVLFMPLELSASKADFLEVYEQMRAAPNVTTSMWVVGSGSYLANPQTVFSECRMAAELQQYTPELPANVGSINIAFLDDDAFTAYLEQFGLPAAEFMGVGALRTVAVSHSEVTGAGGRLEWCDNYANIVAGGHDGTVELTLLKAHTVAELADPEIHQITLTDFVAQPPEFGAFQYENYDIILPASRSSEFADRFDGFAPHFLFQSTNPSATTDWIEAMLLSLGQPQSLINQTLTDMSALDATNQRNNLMASAFGYGFIAMLSLISFASVFNTVSTSIRLRRRELAMLRSIGMTDASFSRMLSLECLFFGLKALLIGLPIAIAANYLIYLAIGTAIQLPFSMPWLAIGIAVCGVFSLVFLAMQYSIRTTNQENIIDILRTDAA